MELKEAILNRHSTRGYLPTPVPQDVLKTVLELGTRAVSAQNTQPWKFAVVTGEVLDKIREANMADYDADTTPDYPDAELTPVQKDRARTIGKQLLTSMEIAREDKERRRSFYILCARSCWQRKRLFPHRPCRRIPNKPCQSECG